VKRLPWILGVVVCPLAIGLPPGVARAEEGNPSVEGKKALEQAEDEVEPSDLTLFNFFDGWNENSTHRHRDAPDMALELVKTNFMEQEVRLDYYHQFPNGNTSWTGRDKIRDLVAYSFSRRLMLALYATYQWKEYSNQAPVNGPGFGVVARFQLVDTAESSYSFQFETEPPSTFNGTQTELEFILAGWNDLNFLVPGFGVYYSIEYDNYQGPPQSAGTPTNDLVYNLSIAKTWTSKSMPVIGQFTTFLEFQGDSNLTVVGPTNNGATSLVLMPGIRFWFLARHSLMATVDIPLNTPGPGSTNEVKFAAQFWATYIVNFF
jgi:hypothetical protein